MKNTIKKSVYVSILLLFPMIIQAQNRLVLRHTFGNYKTADIYKVDYKGKGGTERLTFLYEGIFNSSDETGDKPIMKITNYQFVEGSQDKFIVEVNKKFGIFDYKQGILVEPIVNSNITSYSNSGNFLIEGKNVRLMSSELKLIKDFPFKKAQTYYAGNFYDQQQNGKNANIYSLTDGSLISDLGLVKIEDVYEENFIVEKDNKFGIMNTNKDILLPIIYDAIEYLDFTENHLRILMNNKSGLLKVEEEKYTVVVEPIYDFVTVIDHMKFKDLVSQFYYVMNYEKGADLLDEKLNKIQHFKFSEEIVNMENVDDEYLIGYDYSEDRFWVSDADGNLVGKKFNSWAKVNEKDMDNYHIFTGDYPYHSTIVNDETHEKIEYNDYLYESDKLNNLLVFDSESGLRTYLKVDKTNKKLSPLIHAMVSDQSYEMMELPANFLTMMISKNDFMIYDINKDFTVSRGDLKTVRSEVIKYIISELNTEFGIKNPISEELRNSSTCKVTTSLETYNYTYTVGDIKLFGDTPLDYYLNLDKFNSPDGLIYRSASVVIYPDFNKPELVLSAKFDDNYNLIVPFQDGYLSPFIGKGRDKDAMGYFLSSYYSDSVNIILPNQNKRIYNRKLSFLKATEGGDASLQFLSDLIYIEDWNTDNSYLIDVDGNLLKKFNLGIVEMYDDLHLLTYEEKGSTVYFIKPRKEVKMISSEIYHFQDSEVISVLDEMEKIIFYDLLTGNVIPVPEYDNYYGQFNYIILSKGEKSAVFGLKEKKMLTDMNMTNEQAFNFIEQQLDVIEIRKKEQEIYKNLIIYGDDCLNEKNYSCAIINYQNAKKYTKDSKYLDERLVILVKLQREFDSLEKELDSKIQPYVQMGDSLMKLGKYNEAKAKYIVAIQLKPNEKYSKEQIMKCDKAIADQYNQMAMEKDFQNQMDKGKKFMDVKKYQEAIVSFENALALKPNDAEALIKIKECQDAMK